MISRKPAPASSTCTPCCLTGSGRRGSTRCTRFWMSTEAWLGSVPGWKVASIETEPEELVDDSK